MEKLFFLPQRLLSTIMGTVQIPLVISHKVRQALFDRYMIGRLQTHLLSTIERRPKAAGVLWQVGARRLNYFKTIL